MSEGRQGPTNLAAATPEDSADESAAGASAIQTVFTLIQNRDILGAQKLLEIDPSSTQETEFVNAMISLKAGLDAWTQGRVPESYDSLQLALPVIDRSKNEAIRQDIHTIATIAQGAQLLFAGDSQGALTLFRSASGEIERMAFYIPTFKKVAISVETMALLAQLRTAYSVGDMQAARALRGQVGQAHQQLAAELDAANPADRAGFFEIYGTEIEFAIMFARIDFESLDFTGMDAELSAVKDDVLKLSSIAAQLPAGTVQDATSVLVSIHSVMTDLHMLVSGLLEARQPLDKDKLAKLQAMPRTLSAAEQAANRLGDRGVTFLYTISQLGRVADNLWRIGKVTNKDFGRFAGIVSGIAFGFVLVLIRILFNPTGTSVPLYVLAALIISLIVGFGFGAIRFLPLLRLYSQALPGKDQAKN